MTHGVYRYIYKGHTITLRAMSADGIRGRTRSGEDAEIRRRGLVVRNGNAAGEHAEAIIRSRDMASIEAEAHKRQRFDHRLWQGARSGKCDRAP